MSERPGFIPLREEQLQEWEALVRQQKASKMIGYEWAEKTRPLLNAVVMLVSEVRALQAECARLAGERDSWKRTAAADAAYGAEKANELDDVRARASEIRMERDALRQQVTVMMTPCRCDPLWSGEEYCNGGCELRAERDAAQRQLDLAIRLHQAERDTARADLADLRQFHDDYAEHTAASHRVMVEEVEELRAELKRYGQHVIPCAVYAAPWAGDCDCGLSAALEGK